MALTEALPAIYRLTDEAILRLDLEDAVLSADQPRVRAEFLLKLDRQPGGTWLVVSNNAVFNADIHHNSGWGTVTSPHVFRTRLTSIVQRRSIRVSFDCAR